MLRERRLEINLFHLVGQPLCINIYKSHKTRPPPPNARFIVFFLLCAALRRKCLHAVNPELCRIFHRTQQWHLHNSVSGYDMEFYGRIMSAAAHDPLYSSSSATCGTIFQLKADCKRTIVVEIISFVCWSRGSFLKINRLYGRPVS